MDSTTIAIIGALSTALAGLGGWFSKQGVDAWLKLRADKREDVKLEDAREDVLDEREDKTLRYIIGIQEGDLKSLRAELKEMQAAYRNELAAMRESHRNELKNIHDAHNDCELRYTALETEMRIRLHAMDTRMGMVEQHVDPKEIAKGIEPMVREAKHETINAVNKGVDKTLQAMDSGIFKPGDIINPPKQ
jgi:hypothetical protein